ncbi:MAG: RodZ domain-containing protein, partial [Gammaproteobacteria bacterium]
AIQFTADCWTQVSDGNGKVLFSAIKRKGDSLELTGKPPFAVRSGFFGFSPPVAALLTLLTTKDGSLPQGCITSSFLANLVMWRHEPILHAKLAQRGITYSRYVDDMVMSSKNHLDKKTQTWAISQVYGMLARHGLKASRKKHEVFSASQPMIATKLIVNRKPSLSAKKRAQVRTQVRQLELAASNGLNSEELKQLTDKAAQRVGQLARFHKTSAAHLKNRILNVRTGLSKIEKQ